MASMYDKVVSVISKPPTDREPKAIHPLIPWFKKRSEVFNTLQTDVVVDIIRNCSFVTVKRDHVIIKQGDKGDCFYIILRGSVSIFINNAISDEEDELKIGEHTKGTQFFTDRGELDRAKFGNCVVQFLAGKSFGELALINKNCIRNASIISDETTDLIEVNRELYNRSLRAAQAAEFEERNSFVKGHMFFANWAPKHKKQLAMSLEKVRVPFEGHICRQGEHVDRLYFVLKGQSKILVDPAVHPNQFPQFYPLDDPSQILAREELEQDPVRHIPPKKKEAYLYYDNKPTSVAPYAQRKRERARKLTELSIVGPSEIIGDAEFVLDLKGYLQSVECTQICEFYALNSRNYERLVTKKNPKTLEMMRQNAEMKLAGRIARLADGQIPLFKTIQFRLQRMDRSLNNRTRRRDMFLSPMSNGNDIVPQRGPLIDMFGPGTVFYRSKMREQAKRKQNSKQNFRGARGGFHVPVTQVMPANFSAGVTSAEAHLESGAEDENASDSDPDEDDYERQSLVSSIQPYGSTFSDYRSSDKALSLLEDRIKQWHSTIVVTTKQRKAAPPGGVKLQRVRLSKDKELVPGRTVILRKKASHSTRNLPETHKSADELRTGSDDITRGRLSWLTTDKQNGFDLRNSTGSTKTQLHRRGVPRAQEEVDFPGAIEEFPGSLLTTPKTFLRLYLSRPSPSASDYDLGRTAPPESKGTILDVIRNREGVDGRFVSGVHSTDVPTKLPPIVLRPITWNGGGSGLGDNL